MVEVNDKGFTFEELKELVEGIDSPERLNGVRNLLHTYKGAIRTRAQRELLESILLKKAAQYVNPETKDAVDEFVESWNLGGKDPDDVFNYLMKHVQGLITRTNAYPVWAYLHNKLHNVRVRTAMGDSYEEADSEKAEPQHEDVPSAKKYIDMISEEMDGPRNFYGIAFAYAHNLITREMFIKYMDVRDEYINTLREIKDAIKG